MDNLECKKHIFCRFGEQPIYQCRSGTAQSEIRDFKAILSVSRCHGHATNARFARFARISLPIPFPALSSTISSHFSFVSFGECFNAAAIRLVHDVTDGAPLAIKLLDGVER